MSRKRRTRGTRPKAVDRHAQRIERLKQFVASPAFFAAALALGLLLRIGHVWAISANPFTNFLRLDPQFYDQWGRRIAAGDWMGQGSFWMDPLYPYFLGILYKLFGYHYLLVRSIQVALGVSTCALTGLWARQQFGASAGNVAVFLAAIYKPSIFYEAQIEKTALTIFLVTACLFFSMKKNAWSRFATGLLLGLAVLGRANLLLVAPLFVLGADLQAMGPEPERRVVRAVSAGALVLLGMTVAIAPVTARNRYVTGEWILVTSNAGQNFYLGNHSGNHTGRYENPPFVRASPEYEQTDFRVVAEQRLGRRLTSGEVSRFWLDAALADVWQDVPRALALFIRKLGLCWNDYEEPDNEDLYFIERFSPVLRLPLLTLGWLFPLAAVGAAVAIRRRNQAVIWAIAGTALYVLSVAAFFVLSRYRVQLVPVLASLAGLGCVWGGGELAGRRYGAVAKLSPVALVAAVIAFAPLRSISPDSVESQSLTRYGIYQMDTGDSAGARTSLEQATQLDPQSAIPVWALGRLEKKQGNLDRAELSMRRSAQLSPGASWLWVELGRVLRLQNKVPEATDVFAQALRANPGDVDALVASGELALERADAQSALGFADRLNGHQDRRREAALLRVRSLLMMHREPEAREAARELLGQGGELPAEARHLIQ